MSAIARDSSEIPMSNARKKRSSVQRKAVVRGKNERTATKHHRGKKRINKRK